ncbi:MAG: diguanylate cyclase [Xanthomonadales bacterium]|jgi:diguanylate cyclase (GGDEF)-like protein|nr:diguanylate cyclase [Xanthomonadales bacterium]
MRLPLACRLLPGCALLSALLSPVAVALDPTRAVSQYQVQCFGVADGLPQGSVQALLQHPDGDLIVGTNSGVVRFDGSRGSPLLLDGRAVLDELQVHDLALDHDGALWVAAFTGLYRYTADQVDHYDESDGLPQSRIISVTPRPEGVWIGSQGGLAWLPRTATGFGAIEQRHPARVTAIDVDGDGRLWMTAMDGLYVAASAAAPPVADAALAGEIVWGTLKDPGGLRWFGARTRLLQLEADGTWQRVREADGLPALPVRAMLADRDGQRWFGTAGGGLYRLTGTLFERVPGLRSEVVFALAEDREGNLWAGTSAGFCRIRDGALLSYGRAEGIGTDFVLSVAVTTDGAALVGSNGRGLYRIVRGQVESLGNPGGSPFVNYVTVLPDSRVIASSNAGAFWWSESGYVPLHPALESRQVAWAALDADGSLWMRTIGDRVERIVDGRLEERTQPGLIPRWGFPARQGGIWISGAGGVYRARGARIDAVAEAVPGIREPACTAEDERGVLWCVGHGGLVRVEGATVQALRFQEPPDGLAILTLQQDRNGYLWLATTAGLFRVAISELDALAADPAHRPIFRRYDERHGLRSSEFTRAFAPGLAATAPDGTLWWATMAGALAVDPVLLARATTEPRLLIDSLRIDGSVLPAAQWAELPPGIGRLQIDYRAINLSDAASLQLRQRLLPVDRDWSPTDGRQFTATRLPSGSYRLEIEATLDRRQWVGSALDFRVAPHWTEHWATRLALVLLGAALLVSVPLWRIRAMRQRTRVLDQLVAERTEALSAANARLDQIARTDALTGVANRRAFDLALMQLAAAPPRPLALLLVDVDHFKAYNDRCGHPAGDSCLQQVAAALKRACADRPILLARYGGEEFVALLDGPAAAESRAVAEAMHRAVREAGLPHPAKGGVVTVSIGLAGSSGLGETPGSLLARADSALYQAKADGRDCVRQS